MIDGEPWAEAYYDVGSIEDVGTLGFTTYNGRGTIEIHTFELVGNGDNSDADVVDPIEPDDPVVPDDPNSCNINSESCIWGDSYVTAVKNQGSCGSCWSFSAIAVLETAYAYKHENLQSFSEQFVLDCNSAG